jgi:hypothetical protein
MKGLTLVVMFSMVSLVAVSCSDATQLARKITGTRATQACPVTLPNGNTPPGEQPSPAHHGNGDLWTALWPDGKVVFEADATAYVLPDGSLIMKWPWWRGAPGALTIHGKRLDGPASLLSAEIPEGYGTTGFQASGLIFSHAGCWEVTGQVDGAELTFVTLVVDLQETK